MKKTNKKCFCSAACFLAAFALWTVLLCFVDVRAIGPMGSEVGFSSLNGWFHGLTGVNMALYTVTDWLGLVPIGVMAAFAALGFVQMVKRKSILKVERSILALGVFYVAVAAVFVLFEVAVVNYRPTLIEGRLEASYPSSTTMLVMCVMPTALMQLRARIKNALPGRFACIAVTAFTAFMVIGRVISGVHWVTDIIGGALISAGLVLAYRAFAE